MPLILPWRLGVGNMVQAIPALRILQREYAEDRSVILYTDSARIKNLWSVDAMTFLLRSYAEFLNVEVTSRKPEIKSDSKIFTSRWQHQGMSSVTLNPDVPWFRAGTADEHMPEAEYYLQCVRTLGLEVPDDALIAQGAPIKWAKSVMIANSGGEDFKFKIYPHMQEVIDLLKKKNIRTLCVGHPDHALKTSYASVDMPLERTISIIRDNCFAAITNDCLWAHVATSLLNLPTLVLYGPSSSGKNLPWGGRARPIVRGLDCSPCSYKSQLSRCEFRECMDIEAEFVVRCLEELNARNNSTS